MILHLPGQIVSYKNGFPPHRLRIYASWKY